MDTTKKIKITVDTAIDAPLDKIWNYWTLPEHIIQWNNASDNWHTPKAENNLQKGGKFCYRMEARDGSMAFDFEGVYDEVHHKDLIVYTIADGRKVMVNFNQTGHKTVVTEIFEAENTNSVEMQRNGWQAILNNFKKYVETNQYPKIP